MQTGQSRTAHLQICLSCYINMSYVLLNAFTKPWAVSWEFPCTQHCSRPPSGVHASGFSCAGPAASDHTKFMQFGMQVMVYVGPVGLQAARTLELIRSLGLAPAKWAAPERRGDCFAQISNAVRGTGLFAQLGSCRHTIAAYADVKAVLLKGTLCPASSGTSTSLKCMCCCCYMCLAYRRSAANRCCHSYKAPSAITCTYLVSTRSHAFARSVCGVLAGVNHSDMLMSPPSAHATKCC